MILIDYIVGLYKVFEDGYQHRDLIPIGVMVAVFVWQVWRFKKHGRKFIP